MLLSLLFSLTPVSAAPILGPLGRPANAWFLQQITIQRPDLAQKLHDGPSLKPYTVSTLLDDRGRPLNTGSWLHPDKTFWLRVTTFSEELSEIVQNIVIHNLPNRLELYKMQFRLDGCTDDPAQHPWVGQTTYANIAQEIHLPVRSRQVRLEFATPTAFRTGTADIPLPIPAQVFRSYWDKWNAFSPQPFHIQGEWKEFVADCVMVSELTNINTERWSFAENTRGAATGFTGVVGYTLLPKHQCGSWTVQWEGADRVLQTLAQFAFYCGTGHHATIGMGQTRLIPKK